MDRRTLKSAVKALCEIESRGVELSMKIIDSFYSCSEDELKVAVVVALDVVDNSRGSTSHKNNLRAMIKNIAHAVLNVPQKELVDGFKAINKQNILTLQRFLARVKKQPIVAVVEGLNNPSSKAGRDKNTRLKPSKPVQLAKLESIKKLSKEEFDTIKDGVIKGMDALFDRVEDGDRVTILNLYNYLLGEGVISKMI